MKQTKIRFTKRWVHDDHNIYCRKCNRNLEEKKPKMTNNLQDDEISIKKRRKGYLTEADLDVEGESDEDYVSNVRPDKLTRDVPKRMCTKKNSLKDTDDITK